jgi:hypothetical protein
MQKGSKHTPETREKLRAAMVGKEAPVARMSARLKELEAWCQKYPGQVKSLEAAAGKGADWARDLLTILRHPT